MLFKTASFRTRHRSLAIELLNPNPMSVPSPTVNIARAIRGALLQAETKRWMVHYFAHSMFSNAKHVQVSRGKRKVQIDAGSSPTATSHSAPSSPGVEMAGKSHLGLLHTAAAEADLAALLEVFELREAEVKEHGHATSEVPSAELDDLLQSIGISCSSGELEALCAQLQHIAGRIGTGRSQALYALIFLDCTALHCNLFSLPPPPHLATLSCARYRCSHRRHRCAHHPPPNPQQTRCRRHHRCLPRREIPHLKTCLRPVASKPRHLNHFAPPITQYPHEPSSPKSPSTPASKGGIDFRKDASLQTPPPSDTTAYPSIDMQVAC